MKIREIIKRLKTWPSFFWFVFFNKNKNKNKNIKNIKYVWNKSIAMSCDIYPVYYPKQIFLRSIIGKPFQYLTYKNISKDKPRRIYVSLDFMDYFIKKFLQKIKWNFVLVTGDSDLPTSKFKGLLKNKYLEHWFAQNNDLNNKKISSIPLGIDYHALFTTNFFGEEKQSPKKQEKILRSVSTKSKNKKLKIFANFQLNITSKRREELYRLLRDNPNIFWQESKMSRTKMWEEQSKYVFNFSPIGAGLDCHRTWESLILGQIPIVEKTNTPLDNLHKQFPIVIINDVSEITKKNLKRWYKKYSKKFTPEMEKKLTNKYWINKIKS